MTRTLSALAVLAVFVGNAVADGIKGEYLEARNADVWTGPCFANGEMNIVGDKATLAWKVTEGEYNGVALDGMCVVAVVFGDNTFGLDTPVKTKTLVLVDETATTEQREALVAMARDLAGETIQEVVAIQTAPIEMATALCEGRGCANLDAGVVKITTRCLHSGDSICGHEDLYYPTLAKVEGPYAAYATEHVFTSKIFDETFAHGNSRSAVLGSFSLGMDTTIAAR